MRSASPIISTATRVATVTAVALTTLIVLAGPAVAQDEGPEPATRGAGEWLGMGIGTLVLLAGVAVYWVRRAREEREAAGGVDTE